MVKQHNKTGKKYFCKTTRLDLIETYSGSGVYWKRHLKKHGNDWSNIWVSEIFYDKEDLVEFALFFSEFHDIVESKEWANEKPENGLDGGDTSMFIDYVQTGKKSSETKNSENWKNTVGKERAGKQSETLSKTINDPLWKKTVGTDKAKKITQALKDVPKSIEHKKNISLSKKGKATNKGHVYEKILCPYCGKVGAGGNMKRWHFDNCKGK